MARPLHADAAETRRRILACALALFGAHGVDGVSIRAIASAAGVTLATVHHYFGSKDELYAACVDSMYAELVAMRAPLAEAIAGTGDPDIDVLVDRVVREAFRFARAHQTEMRLLLRQVVSAGELPDDRRLQGQVPFLDQIAALIGARVPRPAAQIRLTLQSIAFLVARFAISSERELELFTQTRGDAALAAVEDHLVRVAGAIVR
jgi:AcrR family transcriptional regulator